MVQAEDNDMCFINFAVWVKKGRLTFMKSA